MAYSKNWCYTLNNPTEDPDIPDVEYHIFGREIGEKGTPHLQGYVVFKNRKRLTAVKKILDRAHWEAAKGTHSEASTYCKKDGDFVEVGELPEERGRKGGKATKKKYEEAFQLAVSGDVGAIEKDLLVRHYRTFKQIKLDYIKEVPCMEKTTGLWIYGASGVGKSSYARAAYPTFYDKPCNKWWDGYQGQPVALIDDVDVSHTFLGHFLKRWADHYAFMAETKGGGMYIRPEKIIVTSQYTIEDIWHDDHATIEALKRRFEVLNFNKNPIIMP